MIYTNEMRHALRALSNPTPLDIHVSQKDDRLLLLVDSDEFLKLEKPQQRDFLAYLRQARSVIELGGGGVPEVKWL